MEIEQNQKLLTTKQLIDQRWELASLINEIVDNPNVDETTGEVEIDDDQIQDLLEDMDDNEDAAIEKAESILFAIEQQKAKAETYKAAIDAYRSQLNQTNNTIEYLTYLVEDLIKTFGNNNKLPTPSFPKLKLRNSGRGSIIINDSFDFGESIPEEWCRPRTVKDLDKKLFQQWVKENQSPPEDENGNPLFFYEKTPPSVSTK